MKKASVTSARRTVLATDSSELGRTAHAWVGPAALLHTVVTVTDTTAPADETAALERAGVTVRAV